MEAVKAFKPGDVCTVWGCKRKKALFLLGSLRMTPTSPLGRAFQGLESEEICKAALQGGLHVLVPLGRSPFACLKSRTKPMVKSLAQHKELVSGAQLVASSELPRYCQGEGRFAAD